jgi:hypothetical protein
MFAKISRKIIFPKVYSPTPVAWITFELDRYVDRCRQEVPDPLSFGLGYL